MMQRGCSNAIQQALVWVLAAKLGMVGTQEKGGRRNEV